MRPQRQVVDYSLRRRALLHDLRSGRVGTHEVCDASPYLLSAARFHGDGTDERCPVCRRENLTHVHYVYGDELKQSAGQARSRAELASLARTAREIQVYVVEVCRGCGWNHLIEQFLLGRSATAAAVDLTGDTATRVDPGAAPTEATLPARPGAPIVSYLPVDGTLSAQSDSTRSKGVTG